MPRAPMPRIAESLIAAALLAFSVMMLLVVIPAEVQPALTGFGRASGAISPAALPQTICGFLLLGSVVYLWRTFRPNAQTLAGDANRSRLSWRSAAIIVLAGLYILSLQRVPFAIGTPIFLLLCYLVLSELPLRLPAFRAAFVSLGFVGFTLGLQLLFEKAFRIYLGP